MEDWKVVKENVQLVSGKAFVQTKPDDVLVLCRIRNGEEYIPFFVDHYTQIGVKHIFFLDNNSTDRTADIARNYSNVTVLQTSLPYKQYKMPFISFLLEEYGKGCWSLIVDCDELFEFPFSSVLSLQDLIEYMEKSGYDAVAGHMLDMFPERFDHYNTEASYKPEAIENHKWYDVTDISSHLLHPVIEDNSWSNFFIPFFKGGVRKFWFGLDEISLTKFPLVRYRGKLHWETIHHIKNAKVADFSTVLLHYKFRSDYVEFVNQAVFEKNFNRDSRDYKYYQKKVKQGLQQLKLPPNRQKLEDVDELISKEVLLVSSAYLEMVLEKFHEKHITSGGKQDLTDKKKLTEFQQKLLVVVIQQNKGLERRIKNLGKEYYQEMSIKVKKLKSTQTWKVGSLIVKPLKGLLGRLLRD
jgi:hypothetical protein